MPHTINTNVMSLNAQRNLNSSMASLSTSMQRLSSGLRVNSARDDAAGLAVAERMNTAVRGANVAMRNANDGVSLLQTVEGGLGRLGENLQRIRELAVQSANGVIGDSDRLFLQAEVDQLQAEIARLVENTKFNGVSLFNGTLDPNIAFQVGPDSSDTIDVPTDVYNMKLLATFSDASVKTATEASALIDSIDTDMGRVNSARASAGAVQSRFEAIVMQLQVFSENTASARGRIMDADYAQETANLARAQVLQQAGSAMLSQANAHPKTVLDLLQSVR